MRLLVLTSVVPCLYCMLDRSGGYDMYDAVIYTVGISLVGFELLRVCTYDWIIEGKKLKTEGFRFLNFIHRLRREKDREKKNATLSSTTSSIPLQTYFIPSYVVGFKLSGVIFESPVLL